MERSSHRPTHVPNTDCGPRSQAGSTFGWQKYVGDKGITIGVDTFGASAPGPVLYKQFGIGPEAVTDALNKLI